MAYRRRAQNYSSAPPPLDTNTASSLATKAIRASSAHRESSLSSVYEQSALSSPRSTPTSSERDSSIHGRMATKNMDNSKQGFWGALARKAKAILDDDDDDDDRAQSHAIAQGPAPQTSEKAQTGQRYDTNSSSEKHRRTDGRPLQKGLGAIASSLNYISNALEEGITVVENRTANIIQETRKIQIRRNKPDVSVSQKLASDGSRTRQQPVIQSRIQPQAQMGSDLEMQLKASRDVSMAMAAKAKLLLRELKTVKADLAFAKERCGQLEEENKILRENRDKGDNLEDDDLVRLQLETLLAEKARLAHENSVYARENRFLREIVEYHQLTMQDVVYLDESNEEVTEVYPVKTAHTSPNNTQFLSTTMPLLPPTPTKPHGAVSQIYENDPLGSVPLLEQPKDSSEGVNATNPYVQIPGQIAAEDLRSR